MILKKVFIFSLLFLNLTSKVVLSEELNINKENDKVIDIKIRKKTEINSENIPESTFTDQEIAFYILSASNCNKKREFSKTINILSKINQNSDLNNEKNMLLSQAYLEVSINALVNNKDFNVHIKNLNLAKNYIKLVSSDFNGKTEIETFIDEGLKKSSMTKIELLSEKRKYKEAEYEIIKLLEEDPKNSSLYEIWGMNTFRAGKKEKGIDLVKKSIGMTKSKEKGYYNLACLYSLSNNKKLALDNLKILLNINPQLKYQVIMDKDFDNIKSTNEFKKIVK